ncbi:MAG: phosphate ABC transporter ATP-binding protein [Bacteroidales bacterium]|jgi:phosphate transport system ATP-binding protein|nr:phosphate ABC transporter ATP-binding protein [Bacteroidales bacterium]MDD4214956.1 phosphate ABC transporter ATP-binding protein [Bacteroidales bacterium]
MQPKISIQNLNLSIGKHHILKNINLDIPPNQVTVILGPSGCGKTTLMKCLNRLIDLEENISIQGNILIDGEDILHTKSDLSSIRKKMGLLSQRPYPLPMNIFDNIAYGLKINRIGNRKTIKEKVEFYLKQVNLWDEVKDRLKEPASRLSLGQQQRLCLARGLAVEPEIILADEPTSALDPLSSATIEKKFIQLKDSYTLIMVTHILRQAKRVADYVVFMYLGEIMECGKAEDFFNNPKQEITKKYLQGIFN